MFCTNCGKEMAENSNFCTGCGASLNNNNSEQAPVNEQPYGYAQQPPIQNQQYPYNQPPMYPQPRTPVPGKGLGIAAMVLGICSFFILGIPCAITGLVLAILAMKKANEVGRTNGFAVAGLVCSIVALAIFVIAYAILGAVLENFSDFF